ncbi:MAG: hypothetical protein ACKOEC_07440, partial [Acidimicrobiia bacterium]
MDVRRIAAVVTACLCGIFAADPQAQTPNLSRNQRDLLAALLTAVDEAATADESDDASVRTHVLRASDGSHYVAISAEPPASVTMPTRPMPVYIRLASAPPVAPQRPERSPIREWLKGQQTTPPPISRRGIALGEMPIMGPAGSAERRPPVTQGMADLNILDLERRRAREREAAQQRQRRA